MRLLLLALGLAGVFEVIWAWSPWLRPYRRHFRTMLGLFWATAVAIHVLGTSGLAPGLYFAGVPRYASDALTYQNQAALVADGLRHGSTAALMDAQILNYPRLLGLVYLLVGNHPLAGGLVNAVFYMASVVSIFLIGRTLFNERAGLIAAWMVACWPSLLLYGTQTMRWVSTTAGLHLVVVAAVLAFGRTPLHRILLVGLTGYFFLLGDQPYLARVLYVALAAYSVFLCVLAFRQRRWRAPLRRIAAFGVAMYLSYGALWMGFLAPVPPPATIPSAAGRAAISARPAPRSHQSLASKLEELLDQVVMPVLLVRIAFIETQQELAKSGIVDGTPLRAEPIYSFRGFVANVPTALYWTTFQPTPLALLRSGRGASGVRAYALAEILIYYAVLPLVVAGVVLGLGGDADTCMRVLLILLITGLAYLLFGTVTTNGGTLHRFRQPFALLQLVFAAAAARRWLEPRARRLFLRLGAQSPVTSA